MASQKQPTAQPLAPHKRSSGPGGAVSRPGQFYHQYKNNKVLLQSQGELLKTAGGSAATLEDQVEQVTQMVRRNIIHSQNYKQLKFNGNAAQQSQEGQKVSTIGKRGQPNQAAGQAMSSLQAGRTVKQRSSPGEASPGNFLSRPD